MVVETVEVRGGSGDRRVSLSLAADFATVFRPSVIGRLFVEELSRLDLYGRTLLDLGCGTGLLGIAAAKFGAKSTCTDINPVAVSTAQANGKRNGVTIEGVVSNGFENLQSCTYDVIVANCPLLPKTLTSTQNAPYNDGGQGRGLFDSLIVEGRNFLNDGGLVLTSCCEFVDLVEAESLMRANWDVVETVREVEYNFRLLNRSINERSLEIFAEEGLIRRASGRYFSVARFYVLRHIC